MKLDDLTPIAKYCEERDLTYREAIEKALADKVDIYYVFDHRCLVIYGPVDDENRGKGSKNNMVGGVDDIEIEYLPCDFIQVAPLALRELWGDVSQNQSQYHLKFFMLIEELAPDGFVLQKALNGDSKPVSPDDLYALEKDTETTTTPSRTQKEPTSTSLKVVGLLMHHLAKSPKYASGSSPYKSEIKKLLMTLADELGIDDYGLNKVDERLLRDAMTHLETQKN